MKIWYRCFPAVIRPAWATVYTDQAEIWQRSVHHTHHLGWGTVYLAMLPVCAAAQ